MRSCYLKDYSAMRKLGFSHIQAFDLAEKVKIKEVNTIEEVIKLQKNNKNTNIMYSIAALPAAMAVAPYIPIGPFDVVNNILIGFGVASTLAVMLKKVPEAYAEKEEFRDALKVILEGGAIIVILFLAKPLIEVVATQAFNWANGAFKEELQGINLFLGI